LPNFHLGGFEAGRLVAIASLYEEPLPDHPGAGWHLRGMAVAPEFQNQGVGGRLLDHALDLLAREHQADYVWCNARRVACGFYLGHGFEFISGEFEIPGIGPHRRMVRDL
jgi:ribosomal protein S18 acetylase RimI-like enzyme